MKRIKILKLSGIIFVFVLNFVYGCQDSSTSEITGNEVESQVIDTSESVKSRDLEQQTLKWCVFGNYCDSTGRHFPAKFQVSIWAYSGGEKQDQLYSDFANEVELNEDGEYAGTTVCFELTNSENIDEYYVEIMLLQSEAYGEISERIIREGVLNKNEIKSLYLGEDKVDYFHFREGCDSFDTPTLLSN